MRAHSAETLAHVAQRLRQARMRALLTQTQVAESLGVRSNTVCGWEGGTRVPGIGDLMRLADLYRCTTDYLLGRADQETNLPIGEFLIDHVRVGRILRATTEAEIEDLIDWDPEMITFWHVVKPGTRPGTRQQIDSLMEQLGRHIRKVAPRLWREHAALRAELHRRHQHLFDTWKNEGKNT